MGEYKIKTYKEGFEEEQAEIGTELAKSYDAPHQTPANFLRQVYSREGFDPETRLYAFKDDKMVGFLTSAVLPEEEEGMKIANLTPPQVLPEHDKVSDILMKKAINTLKEKGANKVRAQFGCRQNKGPDYAKKWGFNEITSDYHLYKVDLSNVKSDISTDKVVDFDYDKHLEGCCKIIAAETERDEEWAKRVFNNWKENPDPNRRIFVIEEKKKIKAFAGFFHNRIVPKYGALFAIWADGEQYMKQMLAKIKQQAKELNIERMTAAYTDTSDIELDKYKPIKFEYISSASRFELDL